MVRNKDRWKASQLITINNYNTIPTDLPSESLSSAQLKFDKTDNQVSVISSVTRDVTHFQNTKIKGNLLVIDKKLKKGRISSSPIINLDIKKLQSFKSKYQQFEQNSFKTKKKGEWKVKLDLD